MWNGYIPFPAFRQRGFVKAPDNFFKYFFLHNKEIISIIFLFWKEIIFLVIFTSNKFY